MPTLCTTPRFPEVLLALMKLADACGRAPERAITGRAALGELKQVWSAPPFYVFTSGTHCVKMANTSLPGGIVTTEPILVSL
jgi:hypothetical protein